MHHGLKNAFMPDEDLRFFHRFSLKAVLTGALRRIPFLAATKGKHFQNRDG